MTLLGRWIRACSLPPWSGHQSHHGSGLCLCRGGAGLQVLVLDAETRHVAPEQAYAVVRQTTERALAANVECIYKKTDSALRGNIGAELAAVMDAAGADRLPFIPAFPKTHRTTKDESI